MSTTSSNNTSPQKTMEFSAESQTSDSTSRWKTSLPKQLSVPQMSPRGNNRTRTFQKQMSLQVNMSNVEFTVHSAQRNGQPIIGNLRPELYKTTDEENSSGGGKNCGKLNFSLVYDHQFQTLIVNIIQAKNLPAKDFSGTSDPYVKVYLLPDRKKKFQTKVHKKKLDPVFSERFSFNVSYQEMTQRSLQFTVYDFDRFSRHDFIGQVLLHHLLEKGDLGTEKEFWKDIQSNCPNEDNRAELGEVMFSLCYLPTAGRLTITIIKARNLKAMDITGASDPYVKVSLMSCGKRLKKRKTSVKKNTLNPVYNEAIVFDIPPESLDQVTLAISVVDYDRVGHSELIGVCEVGSNSPGKGREHWNDMLSSTRKLTAMWHQLQEATPALHGSTDRVNNLGCISQQQSIE